MVNGGSLEEVIEEKGGMVMAMTSGVRLDKLMDRLVITWMNRNKFSRSINSLFFFFNVGRDKLNLV